jgi:hypothetical protein
VFFENVVKNNFQQLENSLTSNYKQKILMHKLQIGIVVSHSSNKIAGID